MTTNMTALPLARVNLLTHSLSTEQGLHGAAFLRLSGETAAGEGKGRTVLQVAPPGTHLLPGDQEPGAEGTAGA